MKNNNTIDRKEFLLADEVVTPQFIVGRMYISEDK
jgi:hypothetical protein